MNYKKSAVILSFAAAMSLLNTTLFAIDMSKSEVIKTTGKVAVKKTTSPDFKKLNSNLKLAGSLKNLDGGDKVRTYNDSTADLALKDTCILMVKEQSLFEVPKILTQNDLKVLKAQQGSLLLKVAKGNNLQVHTADVICGVKGTMFSVTVLDNFRTAVETTGLQLGHLSTGFTEIEVYEGEVEVTDKKTNKKTSVTAKQKVTSSLPNERDFTRGMINPRSALSEKWNEDVHLLMESKTAKDITDTYDKIEQKTGKLIGSSRSNYKSKIYYDNDVVRKINKTSNRGIFGKNENNINERDLRNVKTAFGGDKEKFHATEKFKSFPKFDSSKTFSNSAFGEAYLGDTTLIACKAAKNEPSLETEAVDYSSERNGIILMGFGMVKMGSFDDGLNENSQVLINVYQKGNQIITAVRNYDKNLYWRGTDGSKPQKVPTGDNEYIYNMDTNKGNWVSVASVNIPDELVNYKYNMINSLEQEKKRIAKENDAKEDQAKKELETKLRNNNKVKKEEQKLKNELGKNIKKKFKLKI